MALVLTPGTIKRGIFYDYKTLPVPGLKEFIYVHILTIRLVNMGWRNIYSSIPCDFVYVILFIFEAVYVRC